MIGLLRDRVERHSTQALTTAGGPDMDDYHNGFYGAFLKLSVVKCTQDSHLR